MARGSFALDLAKFAKKTDADLDKVVRLVVLEIFSGVIYESPVDTGMARAGWMMGVGSKPRGIPSPGKKHYPKPSPNLGGVKAGTIVWITNNVPYIRHLEYGTSSYGYSPKAPRGMVRITMKNVVNNLKSALS